MLSTGFVKSLTITKIPLNFPAMCLFPKLIRNPTKRLSLSGGQPLTMYVPCNNCAECADAKFKEWKFRSYHEVSDVIRHGYVVYDTLTYSDEHLPHISDFVDIKKMSCADFSCFNHNHWKSFLKNLRRQLQYHYGIVNFRYFLTTEYGMDDKFTHRPHYHILFFLPTKSLHPCEFSRLVSRLWFYGRTDGINYNKFVDFKEKVFGYDFGDGVDSAGVLKVCGYISKYITKDSTFQPTLNKRVSLCEKAFDDDDTLKLCKKCINQYHRQSQGFGLSFLDTLDEKTYGDIMDKGVVRIYDEKKVVATLPCPLYYKRKLFFKLVKNDDDTCSWIPTNLGLQFLEKNYLRQVDRTYERYYNAYINLDIEYQNLINNLLKNRTLYDLSIYHCLYRGRMRGYDYLGAYSQGSKIEGANEMLGFILSSAHFCLDSDLTVLKRDIDCNFVHCPVTMSDLFGHTTYKTINYDKFIKQYSITQHSSTHFRHFDDIITILDFVLQQHNLGKQKLSDYYDLLTKKFNILYGKK